MKARSYNISGARARDVQSPTDIATCCEEWDQQNGQCRMSDYPSGPGRELKGFVERSEVREEGLFRPQARLRLRRQTRTPDQPS